MCASSGHADSEDLHALGCGCGLGSRLQKALVSGLEQVDSAKASNEVTCHNAAAQHGFCRHGLQLPLGRHASGLKGLSQDIWNVAGPKP